MKKVNMNIIRRLFCCRRHYSSGVYRLQLSRDKYYIGKVKNYNPKFEYDDKLFQKFHWKFKLILFEAEVITFI